MPAFGDVIGFGFTILSGVVLIPDVVGIPSRNSSPSAPCRDPLQVCCLKIRNVFVHGCWCCWFQFLVICFHIGNGHECQTCKLVSKIFYCPILTIICCLQTLGLNFPVQTLAKMEKARRPGRERKNLLTCVQNCQLEVSHNYCWFAILYTVLDAFGKYNLQYLCIHLTEYTMLTNSYYTLLMKIIVIRGNYSRGNDHSGI